LTCWAEKILYVYSNQELILGDAVVSGPRFLKMPWRHLWDFRTYSL